jgi:hypothetical protein
MPVDAPDAAGKVQASPASGQPAARAKVSAGISAVPATPAIIADPTASRVIQPDMRTSGAYLANYVADNPQCAIRAINAEELEFSAPEEGRDVVARATGSALREAVNNDDKNEVRKLCLPLLQQAGNPATIHVPLDLIAAAMGKLPKDAVKIYPEESLEAAVSAFIRGAAQKMVAEERAAAAKAAIAATHMAAFNAACVAASAEQGEGWCETGSRDGSDSEVSESKTDEAVGGAVMATPIVSLGRLSFAPAPAYRIYGEEGATYAPQVSVAGMFDTNPIAIGCMIWVKVPLP